MQEYVAQLDTVSAHEPSQESGLAKGVVTTIDNKLDDRTEFGGTLLKSY